MLLPPPIMLLLPPPSGVKDPSASLLWSSSSTVAVVARRLKLKFIGRKGNQSIPTQKQQSLLNKLFLLPLRRGGLSLSFSCFRESERETTAFDDPTKKKRSMQGGGARRGV